MAVHPHQSDAEIFSAARQALDERLDVSSSVRVHVDHGTVTLTGGVRWPTERREAEDVVRRLSGVARIVNHITVAQAVNPKGFEAPE